MIKKITLSLFICSFFFLNLNTSSRASLLSVDEVEVEWWGKNMLADHLSVNIYNQHYSWLKPYTGLGYGGQTKNLMGNFGLKLGFNGFSSFFHIITGGTFSLSYLGSTGLHLGLGIDSYFFKRVNLNLGVYMLNNPNIATMGAYSFSIGLGYRI